MREEAPRLGAARRRRGFKEDALAGMELLKGQRDAAERLEAAAAQGWLAERFCEHPCLPPRRQQRFGGRRSAVGVVGWC